MEHPLFSLGGGVGGCSLFWSQTLAIASISQPSFSAHRSYFLQRKPKPKQNAESTIQSRSLLLHGRLFRSNCLCCRCRNMLLFLLFLLHVRLTILGGRCQRPFQDASCARSMDLTDTLHWAVGCSRQQRSNGHELFLRNEAPFGNLRFGGLAKRQLLSMRLFTRTGSFTDEEVSSRTPANSQIGRVTSENPRESDLPFWEVLGRGCRMSALRQLPDDATRMALES